MSRNTKSRPLNRASVRKDIRELFARASRPEVVVNSFADILKYKPATLFGDDGVSLLLLGTYARELSHDVALEYIKRNSPDNLERFSFGYMDGMPQSTSLIFLSASGKQYPVYLSGCEYRADRVPDEEIARIAGTKSADSDSEMLFLKQLPPVPVVSSLAFDMAKHLSMPYEHRFRTRDEATRNAKKIGCNGKKSQIGKVV